MNPQLLELLNGQASNYPHHLAQLHPHLHDLIAAASSSDEFENYLRSLLIDQRGNRQGFSSAVISEIFRLIQACEQKTQGYSDAEAPDVWEHVKQARDHLNACGITFNLESFFAAAERGETLKLVLFLKAGMKIDARDHHQKTPLIWAASFGHLPCVGLLLANQAQTDLADSGGYTAIHWAAANGHAEVIRLLLEHGANANLSSHTGKTPLIQAAARGQRDALMQLMDAGVALNTQDAAGDTALHKAITQGYVHVSQALIHHHADTHLLNREQCSAFDLATRHPNLAIRQLVKQQPISA
ncbi:ankyrin repeat domain-containing protein [uncultured Deefgea sp.]|uniref:ankyrin repeat domain-containing protein n=1 Tax=uncultured Deefgea sp. TaxID=1304914 RepID=UPI0025929571|nr:ankyrin repeat domain-containing protein [uncultured Deefgea sp.]